MKIRHSLALLLFLFNTGLATAQSHTAAHHALELVMAEESHAESSVVSWQVNAHTPLHQAYTHVHITRYHRHDTPAVSWQLRLTPEHQVLELRRSELPVSQAKQGACFGHPCIIDAMQHIGLWQNKSSSVVANTPINTAPALLSQLYTHATAPYQGINDELNEAASKAHPELQWLIKKAPSAESDAFHGVLLQANVMDDAIQHIWTRARVMPQNKTIWSQRIDYRSGRN